MKKTLPSVEHVETLSLVAMRRLVADLVEISHEYEAEFETLRLVIERQRLENEQLTLKYERSQLESDMLRFENQQLRDEIARLKNLPPPSVQILRNGKSDRSEERHPQSR